MVLSEEQVSNLEVSDKTKFLDLINKYSEIFSKSDIDLGYTDGVYHKVDAGNTNPIFLMNYRQSQVINKIIS